MYHPRSKQNIKDRKAFNLICLKLDKNYFDAMQRGWRGRPAGSRGIFDEWFLSRDGAGK